VRRKERIYAESAEDTVSCREFRAVPSSTELKPLSYAKREAVGGMGEKEKKKRTK